MKIFNMVSVPVATKWKQQKKMAAEDKKVPFLQKGQKAATRKTSYCPLKGACVGKIGGLNRQRSV